MRSQPQHCGAEQEDTVAVAVGVVRVYVGVVSVYSSGRRGRGWLKVAGQRGVGRVYVGVVSVLRHSRIAYGSQIDS